MVPLIVPPELVEGEKVIKWDEESGIGTPVTLKVDSHGFFLYWQDQKKDCEVIDMSTIRDTRTGKYSKVPKDAKLRSVVCMGSQEPLGDKTITVVIANDFVNVSFINFCCNKKQTAQIWTDNILKLALNLVQLNWSPMLFMYKSFTKLNLLVDKNGKIPIKNITRTFVQNKDDKKKVEKALELSGLPFHKNDVISPSKFTFEEFFNVYKNLTVRTEVAKVFDDLCCSDKDSSTKKKLLGVDQFVNFLNYTQRDPRLNEILHPYANSDRAKDLIKEFEPNKQNAQRGLLSFDGFLNYLMGSENSIVSSSTLDLNNDMDQPLSHYFINSSHNTYLTGHQLTGKSSVEIYRQCLLSGCRCVELDLWNGKTDEPVIVHGYTFVPEISAREVIEAIAESAFKTSDYPIILSFENHCNTKQQAKIAQYCHEYFGDMLLQEPLTSHKLESGVPLPPPSMLKNKIIIKNKKKHHHHHKKPPASVVLESASAATMVLGNGELPRGPNRQLSKDSAILEEEDDEDEESSSDTDGEEDDTDRTVDMKLVLQGKPLVDKVSNTKETEAGTEISVLVNYCQSVQFTSFENAEKKNRSYEMSSFDEKQAMTLLKERPMEFVKYNKQQLSRVYPAGTRFDSSNFMPQVFWNVGCQLVALNYQTLDIAMQLNLGIFEYNMRSGYLLKPEFMRRTDRTFDPFAESTVDGIIAGTLTVEVISGQLLTDKRVGTYVDVEMYGLPADTVRKKFRTRIVPYNGINPVYGDEPFVFKKVVLPELASLRLAAFEESGKFIGHRVIPVVGLCPGYRHVILRNEMGQPLSSGSLFLKIVVKDYVPDGLSDFAEALANPIKFQSDLDKRTKQLAVFADDMDQSIDNAEMNCSIPENEVKPVIATRHQSSCPELPVSQTAVALPMQRKSVITSPVTSIDTSLNDDFSIGPKGAQRNPVVLCPSLSENIVVESLTELMENKIVKEKKSELEKKMENLLRKQSKEKHRMLNLKSGNDSDRLRMSKFSMSSRFVKRLSIKNIQESILQSHHDASESSECDTDNSSTSIHRISRSQSERLLAIEKEHIMQEKMLQEKYHDIIFSTLEKVMRTSQSNQIKMLRVLLDKETAGVMKKLQDRRKHEIKSLAKIHKDKDEIGRMKREVSSSMVEKGVNERLRLAQLYEKKTEELEKQHEEIRKNYDDLKTNKKSELLKDYENKLHSLEYNQNLKVELKQ
ncbi:1-phosphatidylinositol 4,5-bisphosphate phosphodiesterase classes I and II [Daktulosphaira vitifoliae]|uniref:1-phosphatidylinositol 4,5-bisphosphate phosphodiesterase classes I and II n=1 Tax=Daktulosphaira vitifoliae TaxID=58002 RepID=UPI0021AA2AA4|nr:1-phosphatidylinositol 4,5-bisphosphate phosphodiesterase classes I and II [Daktulosphaira vitifoliae]